METIPPTLRQGSRGDPVVFLQAQLNLARASTVPLALDGIFGPKTFAALLSFQRGAGLLVDGIAGPKSWSRLLAFRGGSPPSVSRRLCGNSDPANQGLSFAPPRGASFRSSIVGAPSTGVTLTPLKGSSVESFATKVFGASLNIDRVFMSSITGAKGRPFTTAVPADPVTAKNIGVAAGLIIQILNVGADRTESTIVHECAHAWQSQHHSNPVAFMGNCVACQGKAATLNIAAGAFDEKVRSHPDFPTDFPFSAYGFQAGRAFADYGGEQIAQQIERGEAPIRSKASGVSAMAVDADNVKSLSAGNIKIEDRRNPNVRL